MIQWLWAMSWWVHHGYPNLVKTGDPRLLPSQNCWKGCIHCCLDGIHYERLGKILTTKTNNKINTPNYNIPSNINKQTNNYIMQDHAKQGYIVASQKREIFGVLFRAPLFLGNWCGVTTYILYQKKINTWLNCFLHWLNKKKIT